MTSARFNDQRAELRIFNGLPSAIRDAMNNCETSPPKPSIVRDALLRGATVEEIIAVINKERSPKL